MQGAGSLTCASVWMQVVLCAALLALVPTLCGWTLPRRAAWLLLGAYLVFQLLFLAAEQHWLL